MFSFVALVLGVLVFGQQVVLSAGLQFKFSSVTQCEPVSITLIGNTPTVPTSLTLLPFGSSPFFIPISNGTSDTSGVYVTFLPLAAGSSFIASLDDSTGQSLASVSDVITVLPSPTGDASCLPTNSAPSPNVFTLLTDPSQCDDFTVAYNTSAVTTSPTVRLYSPGGPSFVLNQTEVDAANGTSHYLMNFIGGKKVVLLMSDGATIGETTPLFIVGGDRLRNSACLFHDIWMDISSTPPLTSHPTISKNLIIGLSVGGGVIVLIVLCMVFFVLRERRHRRHVNDSFDSALLEKGAEDIARVSPLPPSHSPVSLAANPPYIATRFLSPTDTVFSQTSLSSWAQVTPEDQLPPTMKHISELPVSFREGGRLNSLPLNLLDIEGILNQAASHSNRSSRQTTASSSRSTLNVRSSPPQIMPQVESTRPYIPRGRVRDAADVPVDFSSIISSYQANPFDDRISRPARENVAPNARTLLSAHGSPKLRSPEVAAVRPTFYAKQRRSADDNVRPARRSSAEWRGNA